MPITTMRSRAERSIAASAATASSDDATVAPTITTRRSMRSEMRPMGHCSSIAPIPYALIIADTCATLSPASVPNTAPMPKNAPIVRPV